MKSNKKAINSAKRSKCIQSKPIEADQENYVGGTPSSIYSLGPATVHLKAWHKLASEPLESIEGRDSAEANPIIAQNLRRLSANLLVLAHLIEYGDSHVHEPSVLEAEHLLKLHRKKLPFAIQEQLENGLGHLPLGLFGKDLTPRTSQN